MDEEYGDLHLEIPDGPDDADWLADMEASLGELDEEHMDDASEEWMQDDLQFDHVSFSDFEVVGNVNTPQPFVEPTPKSAPRPPTSQEARVAVGEPSTSFWYLTQL